ncbi:hypothetical protein MMC31_003742 [Peltigera leucophlebia]|nr:hypothetical protein [Peltigera leucophlebia]
MYAGGETLGVEAHEIAAPEFGVATNVKLYDDILPLYGKEAVEEVVEEVVEEIVEEVVEEVVKAAAEEEILISMSGIDSYR